MCPSVQHVCQAVDQSSTNGNDISWITTVSSCSSSADRVTRESDQLLDISRIERQFQHAHIVDYLADAGVPRLYQRGVRLHLDGFGDLPDLQADIDQRSAADLEHDAGLFKSTKSRKRGFQLVRTDRQVRYYIESGFIRYHTPCETRRGLRHGYLDSRQNRSEEHTSELQSHSFISY